MIIGLLSTATVTNTSITQMFMNAIHNPYELITLIIELLLGIGLGYVSIKILKYVLAFIGIIIAGVILNAWSLGGSLNNTISTFESQAISLVPLLRNLMYTLGLLTMGPILLGFIIGLLIGAFKH